MEPTLFSSPATAELGEHGVRPQNHDCEETEILILGSNKEPSECFICFFVKSLLKAELAIQGGCTFHHNACTSRFRNQATFQACAVIMA